VEGFESELGLDHEIDRAIVPIDDRGVDDFGRAEVVATVGGMDVSADHQARLHALERGGYCRRADVGLSGAVAEAAWRPVRGDDVGAHGNRLELDARNSSPLRRGALNAQS
jgi:hypothetical protein